MCCFAEENHIKLTNELFHFVNEFYYTVEVGISSHECSQPIYWQSYIQGQMVTVLSACYGLTHF